MKYLCLIYYDEKKLAAVPREELDGILGECLDQEQSLSGKGQLLAVEKLQPVETATTVRVRDGKVTVTDGPFAETKEQLGGFYLIDARDLNEAIRIASQIPPGRLGCVEVRPVQEIGIRDSGLGIREEAGSRGQSP